MNWLLKFLIIWFSIDAVTIATGWYIENTIKVQFPNWWREVLCGDGPEIEPELYTVASPVPIPSQLRKSLNDYR